MADATTPPARSPLAGFLARMGGFATDLLLLALFLVLGVAFLDVIIKVVVLIVGFAQRPDPMLVERGFVEWDANRHRDDAVGLVLALVACAAAVFVFFAGLRARRWLLTRLVDASFESFVGKRYLLSRTGGGLANLITTVSVLGVAVGVMALVVVISVMNGFDRTLVNRMMGVFAHVEVWPVPVRGDDEAVFSTAEYERIAQRVEALPGIKGAAPLLARQTFLQARTGIDETRVGALLRGIDIEREGRVTRLTSPETIMRGTGAPKLGEVVLGSELARKLQVGVGDEVYALGRVLSTGLGAKPKISQLRVVGVFKTGLYDVDANFAYASLETVQRLSVMQDMVTSLHIAIEEPREAGRVKAELIEALARERAYVRTWEEINPEFFAALWVEKVAMFIILLLIVLVAAFNIIGTLIMVVTQKTREIGILKSMGATSGMILRVFLLHGFFIGIVGTSLGTAWGLWICRFVSRDIEKVFQMPGAVYGLDRLPVVIEPTVIGFLAACALVICCTAGIIPAFQASRMNPVEALRYD